MKNNKIWQESDYECVINEHTGEIKKLRKGVKAHSETDFFIMYLRPWLDASENDVSRKIKVFIHCILQSSYSSGSSVATDGNYFTVGKVVRSVQREDASISENNIRVSISRLCDEGFIDRAKEKNANGDLVPIRGWYYINPKFGIKGRITEKTYLRLVIEKAPVKPEKGGKK